MSWKHCPTLVHPWLVQHAHLGTQVHTQAPPPRPPPSICVGVCVCVCARATTGAVSKYQGDCTTQGGFTATTLFSSPHLAWVYLLAMWAHFRPTPCTACARGCHSQVTSLPCFYLRHLTVLLSAISQWQPGQCLAFSSALRTVCGLKLMASAVVDRHPHSLQVLVLHLEEWKMEGLRDVTIPVQLPVWSLQVYFTHVDGSSLSFVCV